MLYYLPIWISIILGWGGLLWRMPNITIFNHEYYEKQVPWKKKMYPILFAVDCLLIILSIMETLLIMYSAAYSGIWHLKIVLPEANVNTYHPIPNFIYVSGFNYYLGWFQFLGIIIYLSMRFRDTKKMAQILKEQLNTKYPQENSSVVALTEKILDDFIHTKII